MQRRHLLAALPAVAIARRAVAGPQPLVVELFTSQSCNSCPPADALLLELIRGRPDVLALSYHVTYWDRLGWRDRFSLPAATERQRRYAGLLREGRYPGQVYTPQLVVQGRRDAIGSDRPSVMAELRNASAASVPELRVTARDAALTIEVAAGSGLGNLVLVGFDPHHTTEIRSGENGGRRLAYGNVVRSITPLGQWQGAALRQQAIKGAGERAAVLLQSPDGAILAAATA